MIEFRNKLSKRSDRGFTLVETLVYLAVTVLVSGALVTTFLSLTTVIARSAIERALTRDADISLELMLRAIREASTVNTGLSTLGTSPGVLALTDGATTTRFYLSSSRLTKSVNGTDVGPLTSSGVSIQNFTVNRYVGGTTEMVRISLTLHAENKVASSTRTFNIGATLRGSYE